MTSTRLRTQNNEERAEKMEDMISKISESLRNIEGDLKRNNDRSKNIESEIKKFKKTVEFMSDQYDVLLKCIQEKDGKIKKLEEEVALLKLNKAEKDDISYQISNLEQYQRNRNVEIFGIKEQPNEDYGDIVQKIAEELEIEVSAVDVDVAHRLRKIKTTKHHPIIVQFKSRQKRDLFLSKRYFVVLNNTIPGTEIGKKIFINENLTAYNKELLYQAREKAKELNFRFTWFRFGKVYMRKDEQSRPIIIDRKEKLTRIINDRDNQHLSPRAIH